MMVFCLLITALINCMGIARVNGSATSSPTGYWFGVKMIMNSCFCLLIRVPMPIFSGERIKNILAETIQGLDGLRFF